MSLIIKKQRDKRVIRAFTHKLADIPGGVTIATKDFTTKVLQEGTPVGKDNDGLYHIVKVGTLTAAVNTTATEYPVKKDHNFKVGEFIMLAPEDKAYPITEIDTSEATHDVVKVETTLGATGKIGDCIYQAAAESAAKSSKFLYEPIALVGESYDVEQGNNLIANVWTIGQIKESNIPGVGSAIKSKLKGIIFI